MMVSKEAPWRELVSEGWLSYQSCVALWATFFVKSTILLNWACLSFELRDISEYMLCDFMINIVIDMLEFTC